MSTYLPTVFGENLFDVFDDFDRDFFRGFGRPEHVLYGKNASRLMKTDALGFQTVHESLEKEIIGIIDA